MNVEQTMQFILEQNAQTAALQRAAEKRAEAADRRMDRFDSNSMQSAS